MTQVRQLNSSTGEPFISYRNRPTAGKIAARIGIYVLALAITLFFLVPFYLAAISAFSPEKVIFAYPKSLIPNEFSADTILFFFNAHGVKEALLNSIWVGIFTLALSLLIGTPAGYALAREDGLVGVDLERRAGLVGHPVPVRSRLPADRPALEE